ncbi:hypothetical protein D3C81_1158230 [compost metagenome]
MQAPAHLAGLGVHHNVSAGAVEHGAYVGGAAHCVADATQEAVSGAGAEQAESQAQSQVRVAVLSGGLQQRVVLG